MSLRGAGSRERMRAIAPGWRSTDRCVLPADELMGEVRREFRAAQAGDAYSKKYLLSEGRVRLRQLDETLAMQR